MFNFNKDTKVSRKSLLFDEDVYYDRDNKKLGSSRRSFLNDRESLGAEGTGAE